MSYYVEIDSSTRDVDTYASPNKYTLFPDQVSTWFKSGFGTEQTVRMSSKILNVVVPYKDALLLVPRLYLDIHTQGFDDSYKIKCVDGNHRRAKFVLLLDKIQYDSADTAVWIHYKSCMNPILRFGPGYPVSIEIFTIDGETLVSVDTNPITATEQTFIHLELTPFSNTPTRVDTY